MTTTASVLTIDLQDLVAYQGDIADPTQFATLPAPTPPNQMNNFFVATLIGDIVSVNNQSAKGTYVGRVRVVGTSPTAAPGSGDAIADVTRISMREHIFEILDANGTEIGALMSTGFAGGNAPPGTGAPPDEAGNWAIVGGTGAYLGARGEVTARPPRVSGPRGASMREDPSARRSNKGLPNTFILHVIPMDPLQIMTTAFGPLVMHTNFNPVTAVTPALAHQHLFLLATGLGPTNPDVDLAQPFPPNPPLVNSPLTVTVDGIPATHVSAVGIAGAVNAYHVNFKMPALGGALPRLVSIQVTAAWISGPPVYIWAA